MANYFNQIDEIGEEKEKTCLFCGNETNDTYCSLECKRADNYDNCSDD